MTASSITASFRKKDFVCFLKEFFEGSCSIQEINNSLNGITRIKLIQNSNALIVDFFIANNYLSIESINAENKNTGIGTYALEAAKDYCRENQLGLFAEDVQNIDFFSKQGFEPSIDDPDNPYGYRSQWFWQE